MSGEASVWLQYARENLQVAQMTLESGLLNPCLQNAQQAVEKALKALLVHRNRLLQRTHGPRVSEVDKSLLEWEVWYDGEKSLG